MKTKSPKAPQPVKKGRVRIGKNISLTSLQDKAIRDELKRRQVKEPKCDYSKVVQFAIEATYMSSAASPEGRAAAYLDARDRAIEFEEDCVGILTNAGYTVERGAQINGSGHRCDLLVTSGKKMCIVELKSSGRTQRLELVLGQAVLLMSHTKVPVVVCVPYLTDTSLAPGFKLAGIALSSPNNLAEEVKNSFARPGTGV